MQETPSQSGPFAVVLANVDEAGARELIQTFSRALRAGVFGERNVVSPPQSRDGRLHFDVGAQRLPAHAWAILGNLLGFSGAAGQGAAMLIQTPAGVVTDQSIAVQAFELAPPVSGKCKNYQDC
jgi:hypothetical protein